MTQPNNPKTADELEAERKAAATTVFINGAPLNLHHMDAKTGAALYHALATLTDREGKPVGEKYQKLASSVADLALSYQSIVMIPGPSDMTPLQRAQAIIDVMQDTTEGALDNAADWIKTFVKSEAGVQFKDHLKKAGLFGGKKGVGGEALEFFADFFSNAGKGALAPFRVPGLAWDAAIATGSEAYNDVAGNFTKLTPEQAQAFGAAYAAAVYSQVDSPDAPAATQMQDPNWFDHIQAYVEKGWQWTAHSMPFVAAIGPFISKLFEYNFNFSKAWSEAITEAKQNHSAPVQSVDQILAENMTSQVAPVARGKAVDIIRAAEDVAGVSTAPLADVMQNGGVYRDYNGVWNSLEFADNGQPKSTELKDKNGNKLTGAKDAAAKRDALVNGVLPDDTSFGGVSGFVGGVAGTVTVGVAGADNARKGFAKEFIGSGVKGQESGLWKKADDLLEQAEAARKGKAGTKIFGTVWGEKKPDLKLANKLEEQAAKLFEKIDTRSAKYSGLADAAEDAQKFNKFGGPFRHPFDWVTQKAGELAAHVVNKTQNAAARVVNFVQGVPTIAGDAAVGSAEGVNKTIGAVVVEAEEGISRTQRLARWGGRWFSAAGAVVSPVLVASQVRDDGKNGDVAGQVIHGSELAAIVSANAGGTINAFSKAGGIAGLKGLGAWGATKAVGTVVKVGVGRAAPFVAPVIAGGELAYSVAKGDKAGMWEHGTELGTIGSFAAAGAAIGAPVGGVGAIPGALIGATVGGIASLFTGWGARKIYESNHAAPEEVAKKDAPAMAAKPAAPAKPSVVVDPAFAKLMQEVKEKQAQDKAKKIAFNSSITAIGAVNHDTKLPNAPLPSGSTSTPALT